MGKPINPSIQSISSPHNTLRVAQSNYKTLNAGLELAVPASQDSLGIYNTFQSANSAGVMIRIGATGTTEQQYTWPATAGMSVTINHGLLKQPLGFHVTDTDGSAIINRDKSMPLDSNNISLMITDPTVNATIFIF